MDFLTCTIIFILLFDFVGILFLRPTLPEGMVIIAITFIITAMALFMRYATTPYEQGTPNPFPISAGEIGMIGFFGGAMFVIAVVCSTFMTKKEDKPD